MLLIRQHTTHLFVSAKALLVVPELQIAVLPAESCSECLRALEELHLEETAGFSCKGNRL